MNENEEKCPYCNAGYSATYDALAKHVNRLVWDQKAVLAEPNYARVTEFLCGRDGRRNGSIGHDSMDAWTAVKKLGELAGLPEGWDQCQHCKGEDCIAAAPVAA